MDKETKNIYYGNIGIGIANSAWVIGMITLIIVKDLSLWFLLVPIAFYWPFIKPKDNE